MRWSLHVIAPSGVLDAELGDTLRAQFLDAIDQGITGFRLDMDQVTFMDSSGFSALVIILKKVREADGELILTGVKHQIRLVLEVTGTDKVFTVY